MKKEKRGFWSQGVFALVGLISAVVACIAAIFEAPFYIGFFFITAAIVSFSTYSRRSEKAKKCTKIRLLAILLIIGAMGTGAWFATAPIREAKERADYQASIKTVQGTIENLVIVYYEEELSFIVDPRDHTELQVKKEDGQIVPLKLNKQIRPTAPDHVVPIERFTISEESPNVYINEINEDDIYWIKYGGTGEIKDLLEIKQIRGKEKTKN